MTTSALPLLLPDEDRKEDVIYCHFLFINGNCKELDPAATKAEAGFERDITVILAQLKDSDAYVIIP